ncbi:MAG: hypothetical protein IPJ84_03270 [Bdellovibrionales bacterium]|nr:hypothetical protein [Bdellovibrionales bacterium]
MVDEVQNSFVKKLFFEDVEVPAENYTGSGFRNWYCRIFAVREIEESALLQYCHFAFLIGFWISFHEWIYLKHISLDSFARGDYACLPYFQNCGGLYFLTARPGGYTQSLFYAGLYSLIGLSAYFAIVKKWAEAHFVMIFLFIWKCLVLFVLTYQVTQNFEYFHLPFVFIFLFCSWKLFFLRRMFALLYALAAIVKFSSSWVTGSYFSSLSLGMPFFPDAFIPYATNFVILLESVGSWMLLSTNRKIRLWTLSTWLLFHVYSIALVGFRYPTHCIPILLGLFLPDVKTISPPFRLRSVTGWFVIIWILLINILPNLIEGNNKYTLEGRGFGFYMFDATHQCISNTTIFYKDGTVERKTTGNSEGMNRCDPYFTWFQLKNKCLRHADTIDRIQWENLSSINGGPFYKIINEQNACLLEYSAFRHNKWILDPDSGAEAVGFADKTYTKDSNSFNSVPKVYSDPVYKMSASQAFFFEHEKEIIIFWKVIWFLALLVAVFGWSLKRHFKSALAGRTLK